MIIGHQKQWEFLKNKFENNQLSHAYLFTGEEGIGKKLFANELAALIGCKFPDLMVVAPEDGKEIPIAKIREVQNFLAYKSYNGGFKIVVVDSAHLMNQEAQSCFLKTLEEPKGQTILFLISSKPDILLETIASRCQPMKFFRPKNLPQNQEKIEKNQKIFKELSGVINKNFADKFKYIKAIDFEKQNPLEIIEVIQKYLRYQILKKSGIETSKTEQDIFGGSDILKNYSISQIKKTLVLSEDISNKMLFTNANPKLALEILLMEI
jgi:DNA polymerase-3 subunit delta'